MDSRTAASHTPQYNNDNVRLLIHYEGTLVIIWSDIHRKQKI